MTSCLEQDWDCARVLIESGSELEGRSQVGHYNKLLSLHGCSLIFLLLLLLSPPPILQDGLTPLMICCKKGNIEMVELIINHGGNLKATDNVISMHAHKLHVYVVSCDISMLSTPVCPHRVVSVASTLMR